MKYKPEIDLFELKRLFRDDTEQTMALIYKKYRGAFIKFAKQYCKNDILIIDGFQDAVIALYQNLIENKISSNGSVKAYLFEIGKHKLYNCIRKEENNRSVETLNQLKQNPIIEQQSIENPEQKNAMLMAIEKLGKTCQRLLILFYYRNYSINAIMHTLNMKNENSVKANKSRCIKQLKANLVKSKV